MIVTSDMDTDMRESIPNSVVSSDVIDVEMEIECENLESSAEVCTEPTIQEDDLEARYTLTAATSGEEKLQIIVTMVESVYKNPRALTRAAKNAMTSLFIPIHCCLMNHFDGDNAAFLLKWQKGRMSPFPRTDWALLYCAGSRDETCGTVRITLPEIRRLKPAPIKAFRCVSF